MTILLTNIIDNENDIIIINNSIINSNENNMTILLKMTIEKKKVIPIQCNIYYVMNDIISSIIIIKYNDIIENTMIVLLLINIINQ